MIEPQFENRFVGRELSVFGPNRVRPRLRWYEFKEGFSGELVEEAIASVAGSKRSLRILDPFAGSGTTLVSGVRLGHLVTGIEVNPFLSFAASAKCHAGTWSKRSFLNAVERLCEERPHERLSPLEGVSTFTEREGAEQWLFNRSVLRGFTAINAKLTRRLDAYAPARLALLAAVMDCCNATRDGKCLRYRAGWDMKGYSSESLRVSFRARLQTVFDDLNSFPFPDKAARIVAGDARQQLLRLRASSYDLLVTSPPYLNSFDYSDVYRPEMFLGGFVRDNRELYDVRLRTIRSHVQARWAKPKNIVSPMLPPILSRLRKSEQLWDGRLPDMVQAYFEDMNDVLREAHRLVRPRGQAWFVVSTSAYDGVEIPVDLIIADVATRLGWQLLSVNVLRSLRAAGQHWKHLKPGAKPPLRESLVILQR